MAVSVRDDTIFGPNAMPGGEALATTALTGLVNSFVVFLLGRIPKTNIGEPVRQGLRVNSPPLRHAARPGS